MDFSAAVGFWYEPKAQKGVFGKSDDGTKSLLGNCLARSLQ